MSEDLTRRDLRETALYREAESLFRSLRRPGSGMISDAAEISGSGNRVAFAGTLVDELKGAPSTRICVMDMDSGDTRVVTFGPNVDRLPRFSPDGRLVAFLSDRHHAGDYQLYLLDPISGATRPAPRVDGWVEYLHWSPDGRQILLGVAGHGADISGAQGAVASKVSGEVAPSWMPAVESSEESYRWRRAWVYELATDRIRRVGGKGLNVWEAVWCGNTSLAAVVSPGPEEGLWYSADLQLLDVETGTTRRLHAPRDQLGWPAASPSGRQLAVVEAIASDRWVVAGDVLLLAISSGENRRLDTRGVDVTYTEWRSDRHLLLAGHRGFETVIGVYDTAENIFKETWRSTEITVGGRYVTVSGLGEPGDCALVGESFVRAPEIAVIRRGQYRAVKSLDVGYAAEAQAIGAVETVTWNAPDGLEIQGWLLRPRDGGRRPLVMNVHGGPVWHWRPAWLGRNAAWVLMLVKKGYAVFFPNPRGSAGRGQSFARRVLGDMGGADTHDYLSGLDRLVELGIADPDRLGVTGGSYGGFMTSWLITQDRRFAAAVPVCPTTNQVTQHLMSNIPEFVELFLADSYTNPHGRYFERSPIMHAHKVRTPTLNICGALDRCTPPQEAVQFHNALLENKATSVLVTYPQEGHGVRSWPAATDYAARIVGWFEAHLSATGAK